MFPRVCQTLKSTSQPLPTPFITDNTVIHITPCTDDIQSTENVLTPSINAKSPAVRDIQKQKLPVDGIDSSYRKKLHRTPKGDFSKEKLSSRSNIPTTKQEISNIGTVNDDVDSMLLVESTESPTLATSPEHHSRISLITEKSIFTYTEIEAEIKAPSDEESISLTIEGTVETENIEIEDVDEEIGYEINNEGGFLEDIDPDNEDVFHQPGYVVTQLFHERKLQRNELTSSPKLEIDTQLNDSENRPMRKGIYSYHPPINSFRKNSQAQTPISVPPSPPSSVPLTPVFLESEEPDQEECSPPMIENQPVTPPSVSSSTPSGFRTTPTTTKSFQFRQYYENFVKERKSREISSQLI